MPLTIGLCGLGSAALRAHLPALTRAEEGGATRVVAVTDPDPARRERVLERCPEAGGYEDVIALLDRGRPDLLVIASPPSTHLAAVRAAFDRGIDVLCEKPLGVAHGDAEALAELRRDHPSTLLAPVHQYRHAPAWDTIAATALDALGTGEPVALRVEVERPGTDPLSAGGWRAAGLREGGILGDHAVHYLALCWTLDRSPELLSAHLEGENGHETASVELTLGERGRSSIWVSYAGARRRNLVELELPARGRTLRWLDGELTHIEAGGRETTEETPALSDRQAVNDLYGAMYDDLLVRAGDPTWRRDRGDETVTVAALLDAALEMVR